MNGKTASLPISGGRTAEGVPPGPYPKHLWKVPSGGSAPGPALVAIFGRLRLRACSWNCVPSSACVRLSVSVRLPVWPKAHGVSVRKHKVELKSVST